MRLPADSHLPEENVDEALSWEAVAPRVSLDLAPPLRPVDKRWCSTCPSSRSTATSTGDRPRPLVPWLGRPARPRPRGRARDALAALPARFTDIRPGLGEFECPTDGVLVVPVLAGGRAGGG